MLLVLFVGLAGGALAAADGYQAITGKRLSKKPSRRSDAQMRRQSAIAAAILGPGSLLCIVVALLLLFSN